MKEKKIFIVSTLLILVSINACKSSKSIKPVGNNNIEVFSEIKTSDYKEINAKVESVRIFGNVIEIMAEGSLKRKYKILSKKLSSNIQGEKIVIGKTYNFKVVQLTHLNKKSDTITLNGKKISVMPNHYLKDCIKYGEQEFCSDKWEVYEGVNVTDLYIKN